MQTPSRPQRYQRGLSGGPQRYRTPGDLYRTPGDLSRRADQSPGQENHTRDDRNWRGTPMARLQSSAQDLQCIIDGSGTLDSHRVTKNDSPQPTSGGGLARHPFAGPGGVKAHPSATDGGHDSRSRTSSSTLRTRRFRIPVSLGCVRDYGDDVRPSWTRCRARGPASCSAGAGPGSGAKPVVRRTPP